MHILIYYSKATRLMKKADLDLLLEESCSWNAVHGLTGILAYIEGTSENHKEARFMHVLEGAEEELNIVFEKIKCDSRHHQIVLLKKEHINTRTFSQCSIKHEHIDLSANLNLKAFFNLDNQLLQSEAFKGSDAALDFLKSF